MEGRVLEGGYFFPRCPHVDFIEQFTIIGKPKVCSNKSKSNPTVLFWIVNTNRMYAKSRVAKVWKIPKEEEFWLGIGIPVNRRNIMNGLNSSLENFSNKIRSHIGSKVLDNVNFTTFFYNYKMHAVVCLWICLLPLCWSITVLEL